MRCCDVSVLISPLIRTRSRIVNAMESRISARLPPTWCWIVIAVVISSRSSERTRRTMFSRAASKASPRLTSRTTRLNSVVIGGCASRTTISIACRNEERDGRLQRLDHQAEGQEQERHCQDRAEPDCQVLTYLEPEVGPGDLPGQVHAEVPLLHDLVEAGECHALGENVAQTGRRRAARPARGGIGLAGGIALQPGADPRSSSGGRKSDENQDDPDGQDQPEDDCWHDAFRPPATTRTRTGRAAGGCPSRRSE